MIIARILVAVGLTIVAYKHASIWGRSFMNYRGMRSSAEVSIAYLHPVMRVAAFYLLQMSFLVVIYLLWPYGHWGLTAILLSAWAFKSGMRCELLCSFVRQLLVYLDNGLTLEEAWGHAESNIKAATGLHTLNINHHATNVTDLVRYVATITRSPDEASEIENRWFGWLNTQTTESVIEDEHG